jgi:hypothetical protein
MNKNLLKYTVFYMRHFHLFKSLQQRKQQKRQLKP